jgi:thiol-disulfide isomerase/thioredoxin
MDTTMTCNLGSWILSVMLSAGLTVSAFAATPVLQLSVRTTDGQVFKLAAQRGHMVIINYWATWCEACLEEMPMLRKFAASHPNVKLVGLTYENIAPDVLRQFVITHRPGYPVAHIDPGRIPHALETTWFGMHALPLTYVVSPQGTVAKRWVGELSVAKLQNVVGQQ